MDRTQQASENEKAFILFITAGDPGLSATEAPIPTTTGAGANLTELGIPFSDPVAEGTVIQKADFRALAFGTTTGKVFDTVRRIRQKTDVPLVFMTYISPVLAYGVDKFMKNAADCGIDALIVSDMPFGEREGLLSACKKYDVILICLVVPTSREWTQVIIRESDGFVYCVSSLGVIGVRGGITTNTREMIDTVRQDKDVPYAIGFGISTPEQASRMASQADGVIAGDAIMEMAVRCGIDCVESICDYVEQMKAAVGV